MRIIHIFNGLNQSFEKCSGHSEFYLQPIFQIFSKWHPISWCFDTRCTHIKSFSSKINFHFRSPTALRLRLKPIRSQKRACARGLFTSHSPPPLAPSGPPTPPPRNPLYKGGGGAVGTAGMMTTERSAARLGGNECRIRWRCQISERNKQPLNCSDPIWNP